MTTSDNKMRLRLVGGPLTQQVILADPERMLGYQGQAHLKLELTWDGRSPHPRAIFKIKTLNGQHGFVDLKMAAIDVMLTGLSRERFESLGFTAIPLNQPENNVAAKEVEPHPEGAFREGAEVSVLAPASAPENPPAPPEAVDLSAAG